MPDDILRCPACDFLDDRVESPGDELGHCGNYDCRVAAFRTEAP